MNKRYFLILPLLLAACGPVSETLEEAAEIGEEQTGDKSLLSAEQQQSLDKVTLMSKQIHRFCVRAKMANGSLDDAITGCATDRQQLLARTGDAATMADSFRIEPGHIDDNFRDVAKGEIKAFLDAQESEIRKSGNAD